MEVALVIFLSDNWIFILSVAWRTNLGRNAREDKDLQKLVILFAVSQNESSDNGKQLHNVEWRKDEVNSLIIREDGALGQKGNTIQRQLENLIPNVLILWDFIAVLCNEENS